MEVWVDCGQEQGNYFVFVKCKGLMDGMGDMMMNDILRRLHCLVFE